MKIENFIEVWLKDEIISPTQANEMISSLSTIKKSEGKNSFVVALATIGAILVGIGILFFIASNWWTIPKLGKLLIIIGITFGTHFAGFNLRYQNENFPKIGGALIFLSTIMFGASIFLISQIYHYQGEFYQFMLIWLAGIVPLAFVYESRAIAWLSSVLYIILTFSLIDIHDIPFIYYLLSSICLICLGGLCYYSEKYIKIGKAFRISGIIFGFLWMFLLSFEGFAENTALIFTENPDKTQISIIIYIVLIIGSSIVNYLTPSISKNLSEIDLPVFSITTFITLWFMFYPSTAEFNAILFNIIMFCIIISIFYIGYTKDNLTLINIGSVYLCILLLARYFDFFWDLMDRSPFFIGGGLILLSVVFVYEKHKKQIKMRIKTNEQNN